MGLPSFTGFYNYSMSTTFFVSQSCPTSIEPLPSFTEFFVLVYRVLLGFSWLVWYGVSLLKVEYLVLPSFFLHYRQFFSFFFARFCFWFRFYLVLLSFSRFPPDVNAFYRVLPSFPFYEGLPSVNAFSIRFYRVFPCFHSFIEFFFQILNWILSFTGFYGSLLCFTEVYWVFIGFTGFTGF